MRKKEKTNHSAAVTPAGYTGQVMAALNLEEMVLGILILSLIIFMKGKF